MNVEQHTTEKLRKRDFDEENSIFRKSVFVRTRPTTKFASGIITINPPKKIEILHTTKTGGFNQRRQSSSFTFNGLLHNSSQEEVFQLSSIELIDNVLEGYNGTIFCYGHTGAGKTYTMTGPPDQSGNYQRRGVIPRSIDYIFAQINNKPENSFKIFVSYIEIYNEKIFDLLNYEGNETKNLKIIELSKENIFVRGMKKFPVKDEEEALSYMFEGETQRAICEHILNKESSRSHCVFTVYIESSSRVESSGQVTFSKLHLVDLAGSERVKKTHSVGRVLNEAKFINKSLSFLEQVVIALSNPNRDHIPYRQSQLTHLLSDSIGGNSKTVMIANIWCEKNMIEETASTLKFSTRMMRVSNTAIINVQINPSMMIKQLEKQLKELKRELAMHDQLKGLTEVTYDEYSEEQKVEVRKMLLKYCNSEIEEIEVKNLRQIKEIFAQFRVIVSNLNNDLKNYEENNQKPSVDSTLPQKNVSDGNLKKSVPVKKNEKTKKRVGEIEEGNGFSYGTGIPAKNMSIQEKSARKPKFKEKIEEENELGKKDVLTKNEAYEKYKIEAGKESFDVVRKNIDEYRKTKEKFVEISNSLKECKKEIDEIKLKLEEKNSFQNENSDQEIVDSEMQLFYSKLTEKKNEFSSNMEKRKEIKTELTYLSKMVNVSRKKLVENFEVHYKKEYNIKDECITKKKENLGGDDVLDDAEMFDRLEERRIKERDPQSYTYYKALKQSKTKKKKKKKKKMK